MKRTLVLCVSWKGPSEQTRRTIAELERAGASTMFHTGVTDVSLARSIALSEAVQLSDRAPDLWTLLLLDDDISVTVDDAQNLIDASRRLERPVSGCYGTAGGVLAASLMHGQAGDFWLTGLGFFAVPFPMMRNLRDRLPVLDHVGKRFEPFCCTGRHPSKPETWTSEDFWLCRELGGVHLAPIPAVHWKVLPMNVPARTLEQVATLFPGRVPATTKGQGG